MREHGIPLPPNYVHHDASLQARYEELLAAVLEVHLHAKRGSPDDSSSMDCSWVLSRTGEVLAKQPGLSDQEREAFLNPSPFL